MLEHSFPFDPTYGYDLPKLLSVRAGPTVAGFAEFWEETYARVLDTPARAEKQLSTYAQRDRVVYDVEFDGLDGFRVGGWLTLPASGKVTCGFVVGHGYGGRQTPDTFVPIDSAAILLPCARGFDKSARPGLPNTGAFHVLHGIEDRSTYMHRFCAADLWSATSALAELVPDTGRALYYCGTSFGGGIGGLALPWEKRWRAGYLDVPSFGNHPLRVTIPCVGSGEAVRLYYLRHPEVMDVLAYHDSAVASRFVKVPTYVAAALFDPAVPPPGQYSVYNELTCSKKLFVRRADHFDCPEKVEDQRTVEKELRAWFADQQAGV